jgi:hypothetical protein
MFVCATLWRRSLQGDVAPLWAVAHALLARHPSLVARLRFVTHTCHGARLPVGTLTSVLDRLELRTLPVPIYVAPAPSAALTELAVAETLAVYAACHGSRVVCFNLYSIAAFHVAEAIGARPIVLHPGWLPRATMAGRHLAGLAIARRLQQSLLLRSSASAHDTESDTPDGPGLPMLREPPTPAAWCWDDVTAGWMVRDAGRRRRRRRRCVCESHRATLAVC